MKEEQNIKQLPQNWSIKRFDDFLDYIQPTAFIVESTEYADNYKTPVLTAGKSFILGYTNEEKGVFNNVPVIIFDDFTTANKYVTFPFKVKSSAMKILKAKSEDVILKFVYYYMQTVRISVDTHKRFWISVFSKIPIPSPPPTIQQAIVSKIEELFSELDKGIEQLKTAQQQLKTYRQAVLKWAFEGKLTNENAKEGELPEGWRWTKLSDVSKVSGGLTKNIKRQSLKLQLPFLRVANVYFNFLDLDEMHTIGINDNEIERVKLEKDDLLFVEGNGSLEQIGRVALWNGAIPHCVHQNHLIKSRLSSQVAPKYALYFFCSKSGRDKIKEQANSTSGLHTLSLGKISKLQLPLSTIEEQQLIVQEIESRLSVADKMEETINQSLQQAEALRQSILKKAFVGKLAATDTIETIKQTAKVIPLERKVLAGKIIHLLHDDRYFGLTKFQKMLYLVENFAEVPYETNFIQERAGPYDKEFTTAFRREMQEKDWLQEEQKGSITKFVPGNNIGQLIKNYATYFREKGKQIVFVIQQLKDKSTHEAELIATLYAVWNNRLIKKKPVKIELLVEDFFNWSAKKKEEFQKEEVVTTYKWMKKIGFIPSGFGKFIGPEA